MQSVAASARPVRAQRSPSSAANSDLREKDGLEEACRGSCSAEFLMWGQPTGSFCAERRSMAVRRRIFCGESCGAGIRTGVFPGGFRSAAVERKSRGGFCAHGGGRSRSTFVGLRGNGESPRPERADGDSRAVGQRVAEVRVPADDGLRPARRARSDWRWSAPRAEECAEQRRKAVKHGGIGRQRQQNAQRGAPCGAARPPRAERFFEPETEVFVSSFPRGEAAAE